MLLEDHSAVQRTFRTFQEACQAVDIVAIQEDADTRLLITLYLLQLFL